MIIWALAEAKKAAVAKSVDLKDIVMKFEVVLKGDSVKECDSL
jgi:hypothetical protein